MQALTKLDLAENFIGDIGIQHLAKSLRNNTVSKRLIRNKVDQMPTPTDTSYIVSQS